MRAGWSGRGERINHAHRPADARRRPDLRSRLQHDGAGGGCAGRGLSGRHRGRDLEPARRTWSRLGALVAIGLDHRAYASRAAFETALEAELTAANVGVVALAGFMRLLTADFVGRWQGRMINIHPALLPSFKGLDTHARALATGVRIAGCTVHFVVPEMDEGPIIAQAAVPVRDDDTEATLAARVLAAEHRIYPAALAALARGHLSIAGNRVRDVSCSDTTPASGEVLVSGPHLSNKST